MVIIITGTMLIIIIMERRGMIISHAALNPRFSLILIVPQPRLSARNDKEGIFLVVDLEWCDRPLLS